jgi:hypothetical protein
VAGYSEEQLKRLAHIKKYGTIANYDRSHYKTRYKIELGENNNDTNQTNNN